MESKTGDRQPVPKQRYPKEIPREVSEQDTSGEAKVMRIMVREWENNVGT